MPFIQGLDKKLVVYSLIILVVYLFYFLFYLGILRPIGIRGHPLQFRLWIKRFNPIILFTTIKLVHEFYHELSFSVQEVKNKNLVNPIDLDGKILSGKLLRKCQDILRIITGVDFSLNIKLFQRTDYNADGYVNYNNLTLSTYLRVISKKELIRIENNTIHNRESKELFFVEDWKKNQGDNLFVNLSTYKSPEGYKRNLAYDYVLGPTTHYWLSNNLERDLKNKCFYSTSANWDQYYNSLAVFLISPPFDPGEYIEKKQALGIIIADSLEKNVFERRFFKFLMGYFAHQFYDYLKSYSIFQHA